VKRSELRRASAKRRAAAQQAGSTFTAPQAGLARRGRIKPVSDKRRAENRDRAEMVRTKFPDRQQLCVVYVLSQHRPEVPAEVIAQCRRWADDVHEPLTRARGGSITDPENAVPPCRPCHDALGLEPQWGYDLGLLRHSWPGPPDGEAAA
jgi:hypothetical protein